MDAEALMREFTRVVPAPLVPEFRLHLADQLVPLWQATEWRAIAAQPPPFWAFAWPGSQALARYLLDHPQLVRDKRVMDFGAGSGLAAVAAAHLGAAHVIACDLDPLAAVAQQHNAALNDVSIESFTGDAVCCPATVDVVLAGDVCYERDASEQIITWLREQSRTAHVLLADPGRHYVPQHGLELVATYDVPTQQELESVDSKKTRIWSVSAAEH